MDTDPVVPSGPTSILPVLFALMLAFLLGALDQTIVATALPSIVGELGGLSQLSWVVTAYLLASTVAIPLWGKLGDLYGRKRLFQIALAVFLIGSALSGTADSLGQLIGFRACQGLGAGGLFTLGMAIIGDLVPPRERGRYQGYVQATFAVASVAGPLVGGFFVDHLNWRWIFYVNLPIGIVAVGVIGLALRLPSQRRDHAIDYLGALLLAATVTCLLLTLVWGGSRYPWTSPPIMGLVVAVPMLASAFVLQERRSPEPLLPLPLLRNPVLAISSATLFFSTCAFFAAVVFLPLFLQLVRGDTATSSGLLLLPMMLGITASATTSGQIISWTGRYKAFPVVGLALMTATLLLFSRLDQETPPVSTALLMALFGLGFGMVGEVLVQAVQNAVDPRELGTATGAANLFRALGGSVGVAVYGSVFASQLRFWLPRLVPAEQLGPLDPDSLLASPAAMHALPPAVRDGVAQAVAHGLPSVFLVAASVAAVGLLLALFLEERPLRWDRQAAAIDQDSEETMSDSSNPVNTKEERMHTKSLRSKVLLRSEQSADQVAVIEGAVPAGWEGPPLHHHDFDEGFYVLEGELTFEVNGERITARRGDFAFAPRGSHHGLANLSGAVARYLLVCTPAGFERYFDRSTAEQDGVEPPPEALKPFPQGTVVGPPIGQRSSKTPSQGRGGATS